MGEPISYYQIEQVLAESDGAALCRALDRQRQVTCTLQLFRLTREQAAMAAKRLQRALPGEQRFIHPNLLTMQTSGAHGQFLFAAAEMLPGPLLSQRLDELARAGCWPPAAEALLIVQQLAGAADSCLRNGTLPRDFHPATLALAVATADPLPLRCVAADFGLRRFLDDPQAVQVNGLRYPRPDGEDHHPLDASGQVYVLGRLLLHLLVGPQAEFSRRPAPASAATIDAVLATLPSEIGALLRRTLAPNLRQRFTDPAELASALEAHLAVARGLQDAPAGFLPTSLTAEPKTAPRGTSAGQGGDTEPSRPRPAVTASGSQPYAQIRIRGGQAERLFAVDKPQITVGAEKDNDLMLAVKGVSRRHLRIDFAVDPCTVTDLGSRNGSHLGDQRLEPDKAYAWPQSQPLHLLDYELTWEPTSIAQGQAVLTVQPLALTVETGQRGVMKVDVFNAGETVNAFQLMVQGPPAAWLTIVPPVVHLMNGASEMIQVHIAPPRLPTSRAGQYEVALVAIDQNSGTAARAAAVIHVKPFHECTPDIAPKSGAAGAPMVLTIRNDGNTKGEYQLNWRSHDGRLHFKSDFELDKAVVEANAVLPVRFTALPLRRRWIGRTETVQFEIDVEVAAEKSKRTVRGEVQCPALLPPWTPMLALALLTLALLVYAWLPAPSAFYVNIIPTPIVRGYPAYLSWRFVDANAVQPSVNGTPLGTPLPPIATLELPLLGEGDNLGLRASNQWFKTAETVVPLTFVDPPTPIPTSTPTATPLPAPGLTNCQPSRTVFMVGEPSERTWSITCAVEHAERMARIEVRANGDASPIKTYEFLDSTTARLDALPVPGGEARQWEYDVVAITQEQEKVIVQVIVDLISPQLVTTQEVLLRSKPYLIPETELEKLPADTRVTAQSLPIQSDGREWLEIKTVSGKSGWVAFSFLQPLDGVDVTKLPAPQDVPTQPTPTPTPTPTTAPLPSPTATPDIYIDPLGEVSIQPGQSITLRWRIRNVQAVYLNGKAVVGENNGSVVTEKVIPDVDTEYVWEIVESSGITITRTARVRVLQPTSTPTPPIVGGAGG